MSEYAERKPWDLEPHYIKHVNAMTAEGLHHKAAIAAELAYRDKRIENLEKQLAERDAALARCVEALGTIELEASIFRVDPPMSEDELMAKFEAISELAGNTLESLPSSAKATAKDTDAR